MTSFLRNAVAMGFWTLVVLAVAALNLWAIPEHYLSVRSALELLGTEQFPLDRDPLVGIVFRVGFRGVSLSHAIALSVSAGEFVLLFLVAAVISGIADDARQWRAWAAEGDAEQAREYAARVLLDFAWLALLLTSLAFVVRWDLDLFRFRTFASGLGIEDPGVAGGLGTTAVEAGSWLALLSLRGGWGYLAMTAGAAAALKYAIEQLSRRFSAAMMPMEAFWKEWSEAGTDGDGLDDHMWTAAPGDGSPADLGNCDGFGGDDAWLEEGSPGTGEAIADIEKEAGQRLRDAVDSPGEGDLHTSWFEAIPPRIHGERTQPSAGPRDPRPAGLNAAIEPAEVALRLPVFGLPGAIVTIEEALGNPGRYHVDRGQRRVWDRATWETLTSAAAPAAGDPGTAVAS